MDSAHLSAEMTVAEVLTRWPQTIYIFFRNGMACPGCAISPFETLADVADIYRLKLDYLLNDLQQSIQQSSSENLRL